MIWIYAVILFLHILCCVFAFLGIWSGFIDVHKYMFFIVVFLPFWGIALVLILHFQVGLELDGSVEVGVEKMKLESELYKSINVEEKKNTDIVPMEEALIINNPRQRRELIMDVLNDNPKEYIEFLQKAGNNEDTEVVHYAVTAMVEISKENDYKLQKLENSYNTNPESEEILTEYTDFLWSCLEQNLMQGRVEIMNRELYADLMKKKILKDSTCTDYIRIAENYLKLKNYTEVAAVINQMQKLYPEDENCILLSLKYYAAVGKGDRIKAVIDEAEEKQIYLSSQAKEAIAFWRA